MIQLLINISDEAAEVIRCDGLIQSVEIPISAQKHNPKLGLVCSTPNLLLVIKTVTETLAEATEKTELLKRMNRLESMIRDKK